MVATIFVSGGVVFHVYTDRCAPWRRLESFEQPHRALGAADAVAPVEDLNTCLTPNTARPFARAINLCMTLQTVDQSSARILSQDTYTAHLQYSGTCTCRGQYIGQQRTRFMDVGGTISKRHYHMFMFFGVFGADKLAGYRLHRILQSPTTRPFQ